MPSHAKAGRPYHLAGANDTELLDLCSILAVGGAEAASLTGGVQRTGAQNRAGHFCCELGGCVMMYGCEWLSRRLLRTGCRTKAAGGAGNLGFHAAYANFRGECLFGSVCPGANQAIPVQRLKAPKPPGDAPTFIIYWPFISGFSGFDGAELPESRCPRRTRSSLPGTCLWLGARGLVLTCGLVGCDASLTLRRVNCSRVGSHPKLLPQTPGVDKSIRCFAANIIRHGAVRRRT